MNEVCIWCGEEFTEMSPEEFRDVDYGICPDCTVELAWETGTPLETLRARSRRSAFHSERRTRGVRPSLGLLCEAERPRAGVRSSPSIEPSTPPRVPDRSPDTVAADQVRKAG